MTTDEPAVNGWQAATEAAMAKSTSANLRQLTDQFGQLRADYNAVLLERDRLAADVERLTARIDRQRGGYHLTDKGRAATEERP